MTLDSLNKGDSAVIKNVNAPQALKARLTSFGINKGANITLQEVTLAKNTMEISVNKNKVALRISEAQNIEVEAQ